jgi:hypothetical protein
MTTIKLCSSVILGLCLLQAPNHNRAAEAGKVRLFILSGQSNMAGLNPDISFTPTLRKTFPNDDVIVVKSAQGGQPIRRWYRGWKAPTGVDVKKAKGETGNGDLYDVLMSKVKGAGKGKTIDTITFVWMQGEADAQRGLAGIYEASLRGLIKQLRDDLKRPDVTVVIGRLSDFKNGQAGWDAVRAAQEKVVKEDPLAVLVDTDDLNGPSNALHYDKKGYEELGRRFAVRAVALLSGKASSQ